MRPCLGLPLRIAAYSFVSTNIATFAVVCRLSDDMYSRDEVDTVLNALKNDVKVCLYVLALTCVCSRFHLRLLKRVLNDCVCVCVCVRACVCPYVYV